MLSSVTVRAPAKVNLALGVGPAREDGYHGLATVFHAVGLYDDLVATPLSPGSGVQIVVEGEGADQVPLDGSNLAVRAVEALTGLGGGRDLSVVIRKGIPVAGGMAGGSADAAAALVAVDALFELGLGREVLHDVAATLGSDVPFALHGGTAIGADRGDRLTTALVRGSYHWVFVLAEQGLPTPQVYQEFDRLHAGRPVPEPEVPDALMAALRAGDAEALGRALHNDLQGAAVSLRPHLAQVLSMGEEYGALGGVVSGSGPTVALLARDDEHAVDLAVAFTATGMCRTVKRAVGPVAGARVVDQRTAP
ncbi:MAG: 4-(cytidine 5'-diphospho)-2-C-methyl-D-erythritol kinase [Frankiales bacterium]|nr:4-(cytidine 5'-diphospho)-2-C-methyl-D-erythritol kinase [Frankiales bacterium]